MNISSQWKLRLSACHDHFSSQAETRASCSALLVPCPSLQDLKWRLEPNPPGCSFPFVCCRCWIFCRMNNIVIEITTSVYPTSILATCPRQPHLPAEKVKSQERMRIDGDIILLVVTMWFRGVAPDWSQTVFVLRITSLDLSDCFIIYERRYRSTDHPTIFTYTTSNQLQQ